MVIGEDEAGLVADHIHRLLANTEDALVLGEANSRYTFIEGNFDLVELARDIEAFIYNTKQTNR